MCNELTEEGIILIIYKVIKANSRAHEDLLYLGESLDIEEKLGVFGMIDLQIFTRGRG